MDYKATTDLTVRIISVGVILLFAAISYKMATQISTTSAVSSKATFAFYIPVVLFIVIIVTSFGLCTWSYRVDENSLKIIAPFYTKTINKTDIETAQPIERIGLGGVIRTFGNGGLFGYYGWYRSSNIGSFFFYGTQMKNLVLIQLKDGQKYIITPDDTSIISEIEPFSEHFR